MTKNIVFGIAIIFILLFSSVVSADISFEKIKVIVDGDSHTLQPGQIIKDVKPGSVVKFEITLKANETLEDVDLEVTLQDIDNDNDLKEKTSLELAKNENKKKSLTFTIPITVEETNFDVIINANGYEKDLNKRHENETTLDLEIEKENHEIRVTDILLSKTKISCTDSSLLELNILNTGSYDEDLTISVTNYDLDLAKKEFFELEEDKRTSYTYLIRGIASEGFYPITVRLFNDDIDLLESITLEVTGCNQNYITTIPPMQITYPKQDNTEVLLLGIPVLMLAGLVSLMLTYLIKSKS